LERRQFAAVGTRLGCELARDEPMSAVALIGSLVLGAALPGRAAIFRPGDYRRALTSAWIHVQRRSSAAMVSFLTVDSSVGVNRSSFGSRRANM